MPTFANRVVLITGAGSGIGRQFARALAAEGAAVAAVDLIEAPLTALAQELTGKRFGWAIGDVTDRVSLQKAVASLRRQLGPIDLLIANAGIGIETRAEDFSAEAFEAQINVNLIGVANSIEAVLPEMIKRKQGQLVAISSLASYRGLPLMHGYCASKAGVNALLDGLRVELRRHGIAVTTICPGWIRTPLTDAVKLPMPGILPVEAAVERMLAAIRARRAFYAFPSAGVWQVRLLRWLPLPISDWMLRRLLQRLAKRGRTR